MLPGLAGIAGFAGGASALTVTFIGYASTSANITTFDAGDFVIPEDGLVVVVAGAHTGGRVFSSGEIGGVGATLAVRNSASNIDDPAGIIYREVSAGTHNVTVSFSGGTSTSAVGVYLITNYTSSTPYDTDSDFSISGVPNLSCTLDVPANGVALFSAVCRLTATHTWSDATVDYFAEPSDFSRFSGATLESSTLLTGHTETVTFGSNQISGMVGASWQ